MAFEYDSEVHVLDQYQLYDKIKSNNIKMALIRPYYETQMLLVHQKFEAKENSQLYYDLLEIDVYICYTL